MTKRTRRALLSSLLALVLCVSMLVGSTFAWFTDTVTSGNNIIKSGNLDITLEYWNGAKWVDVDGSSDVLDKNAKYEPGYTQVVYLKLENEGSLALKYQLGVNILGETEGVNKDGSAFKLSDYIYFDVVDGINPETDTYSREDAQDDMTMTRKISEGYNLPASLEANAEPLYLAMVIYMPESVGNIANHNGATEPSITLGLNLVATQLTSEGDAFGSDYDADAQYPVVSTVTIPEGANPPAVISAGEISVEIPADAPAGNYVLKVDGKSETQNGDVTTATFALSLEKDGEAVTDVAIPVTLDLDTMQDVTEVSNNGVAIANFEYDAMVGVVSFEVEDPSALSITYEALPVEDVQVENGKIVAGVFKGLNPATLDETLTGEDSEYIAVEYQQGGEDCYVVSKRTTTKILSAGTVAETRSTRNYTITESASGRLASLIDSYKNEEHTTVYLLPGNYNEASTIYIYSSMDIIGLGDKEDIVVTKGSSSDSNRHLFNANGTKADYIEVSIRNMTLDATAKTVGGKDNAAVQSIRKSKVKCYDLVIVKNPTNMAAVAFYVNSNNAVDGVKYPAYLYVENCQLNCANTVSVVTFNGSSNKFYYYGLTYNAGAKTYTSTSSSASREQKNIQLAADNWNW